MKSLKIPFLSLLGFICSLFFYVNAFAYPEPLCQQKVLDSGEVKGVFEGTSKQENRWYVVIKIGEEDWYLAINYDERNKFSSLKGKPVKVKYQLEQYWDEHDGECAREEQLVSMTAAD